MVSVQTDKSLPSGQRTMPETRQTSFPALSFYPRVEISLSASETNDIFHFFVPEGVVEDEEFEYPSPPSVFISYQWGFQNEVKLLKQHLNMAGYECWLDVGQMGGGDKLFAKIDNGIRGAKIVICCVTEKYAKSPNCNREVRLMICNMPTITVKPVLRGHP